MLPEVILFAQADHVIFGDADFLRPDIVGLVVVLVDGDIWDMKMCIILVNYLRNIMELPLFTTKDRRKKRMERS